MFKKIGVGALATSAILLPLLLMAYFIPRVFLVVFGFIFLLVGDMVCSEWEHDRKN